MNHNLLAEALNELLEDFDALVEDLDSADYIEFTETLIEELETRKLAAEVFQADLEDE